jgi:hypothetical protein
MPVACPLTITQENNGWFPRVGICVTRVNWNMEAQIRVQVASRNPPAGFFGTTAGHRLGSKNTKHGFILFTDLK